MFEKYIVTLYRLICVLLVFLVCPFLHFLTLLFGHVSGTEALAINLFSSGFSCMPVFFSHFNFIIWACVWAGSLGR